MSKSNIRTMLKAAGQRLQQRNKRVMPHQWSAPPRTCPACRGRELERAYCHVCSGAGMIKD